MRAFGEVQQLGDPALYEEPRWYACYTRARHEKRVDGLLAERGIESYLPTRAEEREWSDRKKVVDFPLFPSYVFGRFTLADVHQVLTIPGVSTIVRREGIPAPIPDPEIDNIRRFQEALARTGQVAEPNPLQEGQWVRVTSGPFSNVEGVVVERRGRKRVLVGLRTIGQGLEVDIDTRILQPIRLGGSGSSDRI